MPVLLIWRLVVQISSWAMDVFSSHRAVAWYFARLFITKRWLAFTRQTLIIQNAKFSTFWGFPPNAQNSWREPCSQAMPEEVLGELFTTFAILIGVCTKSTHSYNLQKQLVKVTAQLYFVLWWYLKWPHDQDSLSYINDFSKNLWSRFCHLVSNI